MVALPTLVVAVALLAASARADIVHLKNGMRLEGRVISERDGTVVVEMASGVVRLPAKDVLRIERREGPENLASDLRAMARAGRGREALARLDRDAAPLGAKAAARLRLDILRAEARRLERTLRFAEAHKVLAEAATLAPADGDLARSLERLTRKLTQLKALVKEARLAVEEGRHGEAARAFEDALEVAPEGRALIGTELADCYEKLGDRALSKSDAASAGWYRKVLDVDPSRAEVLKERYVHARLLPVLGQLKAREFDRAKRVLDDLLRLAPDDCQTRYVYGSLLQAKKDWAGARAHFLAALVKAGDKARPKATPPATREGVRSLRKAVEKQLVAIHERARSRRRLRDERTHVEAGPGMRLEGRLFTIHHRNGKLARELLEAAEAHVGKVAALLQARGEADGEAGDERGRAPWDTPCPVYLLVDEEAFLTATGQPSWSGGVSHTETVKGRLTRQYLTVYQTSPRLLVTTVPHEVTHLAFSALTGYAPGVPLVLHEGLAVSSEPAYDERKDRGMLAWKRLAGELIPLEALFETKGVQVAGAGADPRLYYAESASLVRFLIGRNGGATFLEFAKEAGVLGIEEALAKHYGLGGGLGDGTSAVDALEREWLASLDG